MTQKNKARAIICPSCGKLISANARECIHCGRRQPGLWGLTPLLNKIFGGRVTVVPAIITTCVTLYIISLIIDPGAIFQPRGLLGLFAPSRASLLHLGATGSFFLRYGRWWTVITAIYLHGGIIHLLFNMLWARQLGTAVESFYGSARFIVIFTVAGVVGFVISNIAGIPLTIGASGSIFGLMGALVYYGRHRGGYFGGAIFRQVITWAAVLFFMGFVMPGINNFAHAGGFIGGYVCAAWLGYEEIKRSSATHNLLAVFAIALTLFSFLLTFLTAL